MSESSSFTAPDGEPPLVALSLTHVHYDPTDTISLLSAWLALLPLFLMCAQSVLLFSTRELESAFFLVGQLSCEALNFALKRAFKESRPSALRHGYGMPSSHAQFVGFFAGYITLILVVRGVKGDAWKYATVSWIGSWAVAASRVYLGYHTRKQVVVGYAVGLAWALVWYALTAWVRGSSVRVWGATVYEWVLWVGSVVWIRDRCTLVDLVVEGWEVAERERGERIWRKVR